MRDWDLTSGEPLSLCIAADARLCQPNYSDDQTWELRLEGGEPASLAIETTYGLRARGMRIFPAFQIGEQYRLDPATFAGPPHQHLGTLAYGDAHAPGRLGRAQQRVEQELHLHWFDPQIVQGEAPAQQV